MFHPSAGFTHRQRVSAAFLTLALILTLALPAIAAPAGPAALPTIDHFDTDQGPLESTGAPATNSLTDAGVLGGVRDLQIEVTSGTGKASINSTATSSALRYSTETQVSGEGIVQWDKTAGFPVTETGLGGEDLTQGNTQNTLVVTSLFNDLSITLTFKIYTDASNWSSLSVMLPGGQDGGSIKYYWPFAGFEIGGGTGADFANVGAVELIIAGGAGRDLTIHEVGTAGLDWGDLPDESTEGSHPDYPTQFANNGPRHAIGTLFLGAEIDSVETDGVPSAAADGDDTNTTPDDEDGVAPTSSVKWTQGFAPANGGSVDVTVAGGPGCLSGWIDWNGDGTLTGANEIILNNILVVTGTQTLTFNVPVSPADGTFYARFRLYAPDSAVQGQECTTTRTPTGFAENGEVEDYRWSFGPNAVSLSNLQASPAAVLPLAPLGLAALAGLGAMAALWAKRRRG